MTIGVDLGDRRSDLCILDSTGRVEARRQAATTETGLTTALRAYAGARVVVEVGTHSPWVSRLLGRLGHEVVVANPRRVRRIAAQEDKSDRIDAELLARLGRVDPALLRPIRHRGEQVQRDRAVLRVRDALVRARAMLVTQARGLAKSLGTRLPRCDAQTFAKRMTAAGLSAAFPGCAALLATVAELSQQIRALDTAIARVGDAQYPATRTLRQVAGVGPVTALAFVVTLEDPTRFPRSRAVGAYLGLRPKKRQSGDQDPALRITKAGDAYLRRMLVQAAQYILGPYGPDTALRRFGERLIARGGGAARKKAVVAVARKLAVLLHRLWVTGAPYEPLRGMPREAVA
ncbi:MAG TPA: IS110 family transposase [Candidatus Eisenbacteria bacterium]|nr:IS110 family transposase [Candidatus Eisenbacteria bacterium]